MIDGLVRSRNFAGVIPEPVMTQYSEDTDRRLTSATRWMPCSGCHDEVPAGPIRAKDLVDFEHPTLAKLRVNDEGSEGECETCGRIHELVAEEPISWWYPQRARIDGTAQGTGPDGRCLAGVDVWRLACP